MAKKPTETKKADPFEALAVGLTADHKAEQLKGESDAVAEAVTEAVADGAVDGVAAAAAEATAENEPAPTPPAPGEDADSVFQRRMERLTNAVEFAEFESGTAFGDLRDLILDLFKQRPKLWPAMTPSEKHDMSRHVEGVAKGIIRKIVLVIAQEESLTIQGTLLGKFAVNGEAVEAKLKIDHVDADVMLDIFKMAGHKVVIVSADDKRFASARRDLPSGEDQIPLAFADDAPKASPTPAPTPPADDSDLNPADPPAAPEDAQTGTFGVFDKAVGEWLIDENGGDDGWTSNLADAGRWTEGKATDLARAFDEGGEVSAQPIPSDPPAEEEDDDDQDEGDDAND